MRVRDAAGRHPTIPFWLGEAPGRTDELSEEVSRLRSVVADHLDSGGREAAVELRPQPRLGSTRSPAS